MCIYTHTISSVVAITHSPTVTWMGALNLSLVTRSSTNKRRRCRTSPRRREQKHVFSSNNVAIVRTCGFNRSTYHRGESTSDGWDVMAHNQNPPFTTRMIMEDFDFGKNSPLSSVLPIHSKSPGL